MCEKTMVSSGCVLGELGKLSRAEEEKLQMFQLDLMKNSTVWDAGENSAHAILETKVTKLKAELSEVKSIQYEGIPVCMLLQIALLKQHLREEVRGLKESLSHIKHNKMELKKQKDKLRKNLEQEHRIMEIVTNNQMLEVKCLPETLPSQVTGALEKLNEKLLKIKTLKNIRVIQLQKFLHQHFPLPDELAMHETSKRDIFAFSGRSARMKSLAEIVEVLTIFSF